MYGRVYNHREEPQINEIQNMYKLNFKNFIIDTTLWDVILKLITLNNMRCEQWVSDF